MKNKAKYIDIPRVPRVPRISDIKRAMEVRELLERNGYGLSYFSRNSVGFYKKKFCAHNQKYVLLDDWAMMTKKEFKFFIDVLKELDDYAADALTFPPDSV